MIVRDWNAWLLEKYGPKQVTFRSQLKECAEEEAEKLQKEFGWNTHEVSITKDSVHLSFTLDGGLYYIMIPVQLVARTMCISKPLRDGVEKVLERYSTKSNPPQDSQESH